MGNQNKTASTQSRLPMILDSLKWLIKLVTIMILRTKNSPDRKNNYEKLPRRHCPNDITKCLKRYLVG